MPTPAKCVYWNQSDNLSGRPIVLSITKYNDKTTEILINYVLQNRLYRRTILLCLIIVVNLISFMYDILNTTCSAVIFLLILFIIYDTVFTVTQEKIVVVESLGYQLEEHYVLGQITRYIPWEHVKSIIINEVVSKQRVIFILAMLTKDTAKEAIIPLFTKTMPRLPCLEAIYQYIENCH